MIESPNGKILHGCPSVGQGVYAGTSDEVIDAVLVSAVSVGAVLAEESGLSDSEVELSDAVSELTAADELPIDVADAVGSEEPVVVGVTGAVVDDAGELEVVPGPVGCVLEDGALEESALEDSAPVVTPDVVLVDGAGFVFGSVDCPQLSPKASGTQHRSVAPVDELRIREAFAFTFA